MACAFPTSSSSVTSKVMFVARDAVAGSTVILMPGCATTTANGKARTVAKTSNKAFLISSFEYHYLDSLV